MLLTSGLGEKHGVMQQQHPLILSEHTRAKVHTGQAEGPVPLKNDLCFTLAFPAKLHSGKCFPVKM